MITVLLLAAALQTTPAPEDLSYGETYACHLMATMGMEMMEEGGGEPTDHDRVVFEALQAIADRAGEALPAAQARAGYPDHMIPAQQQAARNGLAQASPEQADRILPMCAAVFGVEDPG